MSDRGLYVCTLRSHCGRQARASSILEVEPQELPTAELYPAATQTVITGKSALFQCRYMTGIPTPTITWTRKDGGKLPPNVEVLSGGILRYLNKQALRNSCELLRQRKELHASSWNFM